MKMSNVCTYVADRSGGGGGGGDDGSELGINIKVTGEQEQMSAMAPVKSGLVE